MLYIVNESTFSGYSVYNLDLLYIVAILLGILVIISKNPIVSVLFLIGLFLCISGYLILTGLNFIGLSYLLVYIGAVSILFLFILMLINVRISELLIDSINSIPLAILIGGFFNYFVNNVLPYMVMTSDLLYYFSIKKILTNVTSMSWDGYLAETSHITSIGNILYGSYSIWLIITSIILLLAMVGCIVITLKEKTYNVNNNDRNHPLTTSLPLQSGLFSGIYIFFLKLKVAGSFIFSRDYVKSISNKLFTVKTFIVVLCSIIISAIVRYFLIKYGVDNPLLSHPFLFSSAAGISSFLSIPSRLTIEELFNRLSDKKLSIAVGDSNVTPNIANEQPVFKMVGSNKGNNDPRSQLPEALDNTHTKPKNLDFSKIDTLLLKLKSQINSAKVGIKLTDLEIEAEIKKIESEIDKELVNLRRAYSEGYTIHGVNGGALLMYCSDLTSSGKFNDLKPVLDEIYAIIDKGAGNPNNNPAIKDQVKFFKEQIKYASRVRDNTNREFNILKKWVTTNKVLTAEQKTALFDGITEVKTGAKLVHKQDIDILERLVEKSTILKELQNKKQ